jgi:hypothetical protein
MTLRGIIPSNQRLLDTRALRVTLAKLTVFSCVFTVAAVHAAGVGTLSLKPGWFDSDIGAIDAPANQGCNNAIRMHSRLGLWGVTVSYCIINWLVRNPWLLFSYQEVVLIFSYSATMPVALAELDNRGT